MKKIEKLSDNSINKLSSGPIISSIKDVIKELIENSIDSEATNIEIRCKNQGFTSIEVIDDGVGISEENFENLCKRFCTSKIDSDKIDEELLSYGFR
jgi:DNA mismatch repair ATPase MutL